MKDYNDWIIKRWETPVSDCKSFVLKSLLIESSAIVIKIECDAKTFEIQFHGLPSVRMIDEGYRSKLWLKVPMPERSRLGNIWIVENTDFLEFLKNDDLFSHQVKKPKQYVFLFDNEIIEVVSDVEPEIQIITSS